MDASKICLADWALGLCYCDYIDWSMGNSKGTFEINRLECCIGIVESGFVMSVTITSGGPPKPFSFYLVFQLNTICSFSWFHIQGVVTCKHFNLKMIVHQLLFISNQTRTHFCYWRLLSKPDGTICSVCCFKVKSNREIRAKVTV